jgi:Acetyltransferases, including N-acetylases of ribosomal proteins
MLGNYSFLESKQLYLRPFEDADEEFFMKWYNDKETRSKIGEVMPLSRLQAGQLVRREGKDSVWFAIVRKEDNQVIGETGLLRMFPAWRTTDLTIIIPDKKHQGKGYGTEAINLIMDYAFGYFDYNRIAIGVVGFNTYALNFYRKVGFKQEGIQEQGYYFNYKYYDFIMMRILKNEFMEMCNIQL